MRVLLFLFGLSVVYFAAVHGHGKLIKPPARSTLMNKNANSNLNYVYNLSKCGNRAISYSDKGLNCGGTGVQHGYKGWCGACGDTYVSKAAFPRPHDKGGKYAKETVPVAAYKIGQEIDVHVYMSAPHKGHSEFRLCNVDEKDDKLTECFMDPYVIKLKDASGKHEFGISAQAGINKERVFLDKSVSCPFGCVLQWWYKAGNNYGDIQEHFVNCADIIIMSCDDYLSKNYGKVCAMEISEELKACGSNNGGTDNSSGGSGASDGSWPDNGSGSYDQVSNASTSWAVPALKWSGRGTCAGSGVWEGTGSCANPGNGLMTCTGTGSWDGSGICVADDGDDDVSSDEFYGDMSCDECLKLFNQEHMCEVCCKKTLEYEGIDKKWNNKCKKICPGKTKKNEKRCGSLCKLIEVFERGSDTCRFPDFDDFDYDSVTCEDCSRFRWIECPHGCCMPKPHPSGDGMIWLDICKQEDKRGNLGLGNLTQDEAYSSATSNIKQFVDDNTEKLEQVIEQQELDEETKNKLEELLKAIKSDSGLGNDKTAEDGEVKALLAKLGKMKNDRNNKKGYNG